MAKHDRLWALYIRPTRGWGGQTQLPFRRAPIREPVQVHTSRCGWVFATRLEWFGTDRLQCEVMTNRNGRVVVSNPSRIRIQI